MKKKYNLIILLLAIIWLAVTSTTETPTGKVVAVSDGDTIRVLVNNEEIKVRLYGVDSPEKKQAYGAKAKDYTSSKCFGKVVTIKEQGKDRYGRLLGYVILPNDENLNELLVRDGMAWWYRQYAPDDKRLEKLEKDARKAKLGLWQDKSPVPPWEFRKRKR